MTVLADHGNSPLRIALISEHASPAALLGGEDAGGQNVYVDELSRQLGLMDIASTSSLGVIRRNLRKSRIGAGGADCQSSRRSGAIHAEGRSVAPDPAFRDELIRFVLRDGRRYDIAHGNFWMSGWVACELRRVLGIPAVQLFHALGATKQRHQGRSDASPAERIEIERAITRTVDRVIATCPHEVDELLSDYRMAPSQIDTIPLGVDCSTFSPVEKEIARERIGLPVLPDDHVIAYVGRIVPRKDVRNVLRALAILRQTEPDCGRRCTLIVVGGESRQPDPEVTPELGELQRLAADLGLSDRVVFTGKRSQAELRDYYSAGDVAVTTPWYEPFGLTPLEAMACGRPVIGANVGGIRFSVVHGRTGFLVSPREPGMLARELARLFADSRRQIALGQAARIRVERAFTWPIVAARTVALYRDVLQRTMPHRSPEFRSLAMTYTSAASAAGD